jgi:hypothetical protein
MLFTSAQWISQDNPASVKEGFDKPGADRREIPVAFFPDDENSSAFPERGDGTHGAEWS